MAAAIPKPAPNIHLNDPNRNDRAHQAVHNLSAARLVRELPVVRGVQLAFDRCSSL
jgi:hypothetical protein